MLRENSMGKESQSEIGRLCYTKYEDRFRDIDSRIEKINDAIQEKLVGNMHLILEGLSLSQQPKFEGYIFETSRAIEIQLKEVQANLQKYTNDILNNAKIIKRASELKTMLSDFLMILVQLDAFNGVDYNDSESILYKSYLLSTIDSQLSKPSLSTLNIARNLRLMIQKKKSEFLDQILKVILDALLLQDFKAVESGCKILSDYGLLEEMIGHVNKHFSDYIISSLISDYKHLTSTPQNASFPSVKTSIARVSSVVEECVKMAATLKEALILGRYRSPGGEEDSKLEIDFWDRVLAELSSLVKNMNNDSQHLYTCLSREFPNLLREIVNTFGATYSYFQPQAGQNNKMFAQRVSEFLPISGLGESYLDYLREQLAQFSDAAVLDKDYPYAHAFVPPKPAAAFVAFVRKTLLLSYHCGIFQDKIMDAVARQIEITASNATSVDAIGKTRESQLYSMRSQIYRKLHTVNTLWFIVRKIRAGSLWLPSSHRDHLYKALNEIDTLRGSQMSHIMCLTIDHQSSLSALKDFLEKFFVEQLYSYTSTLPKEIVDFMARSDCPEKIFISLKHSRDLLEKLSCNGAQFQWITCFILELINVTNQTFNLKIFADSKTEDAIAAAAGAIHSYFSEWLLELGASESTCKGIDEALAKLKNFSNASHENAQV